MSETTLTRKQHVVLGAAVSIAIENAEQMNVSAESLKALQAVFEMLRNAKTVSVQNRSAHPDECGVQS